MSELGNFTTRRDDYPSAAALLEQPLGRPLPEWVADHFAPMRSNTAKIGEELRRFRSELALELVRYEEIRLNGAAVLSEFDIKIAASGSADCAEKTAIALVYNHILYFRMHIEWVRVNLPGLLDLPMFQACLPSIVDEQAEQLNLF